MSLKALVTTLVVGTSAVASAHPTTFERHDGPAVRDHRWGDRDGDRHERFRDRDRDRSWWRSSWRYRRAPVQAYVAPTYVAPTYVAPTYQSDSYGYYDNGYANGYAQQVCLLRPTALGGHLRVDVPEGAGLRTIRFQNAGAGSSYVEEVTIVYREGRAQVVDIDRTLDTQNPTYDLAVGPGVAQLIVEGTSQPGGAITADAL